MKHRVVVVGTGTEIGKTHVACCLIHAARARGIAVSAFKPVATGAPRPDACEDALLHARAGGGAYVTPSFVYLRPVSPHLAAREEGRPIDLATVRARADELAAGADLQLVESAGGLFSPLGPGTTNADLVRALEPAGVVLVAPDRLGVLHDLAAALRAARAEGLAAPVVVLSASEGAWGAGPGPQAAEIAALGLADVAATFPRAAWDAAGSVAEADKVLAALGIR